LRTARLHLLITSSTTHVSASTNLIAPTQALVFLSMRDVYSVIVAIR
jgi:hypothetical protein